MILHQLLNLTRPLIVLDTETTGIHSQARIVELGFQKWVPEDGMVREWKSLINPGIPIPEAAAAVHHITDDMVTGCQTCGQMRLGCQCNIFHAAPQFSQIAVSLAEGFSDCDFAGKNIRFDLRVLTYEFLLAKQPWNYSFAYIVDIDRLEQIAEPRNLGALHKKYTGEEHEGAHGALSDVRASTTVIVAQLNTYPTLPRNVKEIHDLSWPGWLTTDGSFKLVNGVPTVMFGKHRNTAMQDVPPSYWDWIIKSDFPEDVKALAGKAKLKEFPRPTLEETLAADKRMI